MRVSRAVVVLVAVLGTPVHAELQFEFEDSFSPGEQEKLVTWVTEVKDGVEELVGEYPIDIRVQFTRSWSRKPVPFGRTLRGHRQGIRFHVNPRFSLDELRSDWTAAHEFSHLVLPFLGRERAWFAEGFASFMQYQVMYSMGVIDSEEVTRRYRTKLDKAARRYHYPDRAFVATAPRLRAERKYPVMYWGGAVFFFTLNEALEAHADTTVIELVSDYMRCCRRSRNSLTGLAADLDRIIGSPVVSEELGRFESVIGFPRYEELPLGVVADE
jgi:hypothetical protein